jgi:hypothetical protein
MKQRLSLNLHHDNDIHTVIPGTGISRGLHTTAHCSLCEHLDLLSHHGDASVITSIQLQDAASVQFRPIQGPSQGQDGGCLARSGRPMEEQMWQVALVDGHLEGLDHFILMRHLVHSMGTILLTQKQL